MRLLTTEEWDLVEKCFMREMTRRRGPTYDVALATNAKIDADNAVRAAMTRHALSIDKCNTIALGSYAQPGADLDWIYVACLAARFGALTYQDQALIVSMLEQGQCIDWTHQRWAYAMQTTCPQQTFTDTSYSSIAKLRQASWDPFNPNAGAKYSKVPPTGTPAGSTPPATSGFDWVSYCKSLPAWASSGVPVCAGTGTGPAGTTPTATPPGGSVATVDWKAYCATLPAELAKSIPGCSGAGAGGSPPAPGGTGGTPAPGTDWSAYCASLPANIAAAIPMCSAKVPVGGSTDTGVPGLPEGTVPFKEWHDPGPNCRWNCLMVATGNKDTDAASTAKYIDCLQRNHPGGGDDYSAIATWYTQAQPGHTLGAGGPESCPAGGGTTTTPGTGGGITTTTGGGAAAPEVPWYKQPVTYAVGGAGVLVGLGLVVAALRRP